MKLFVNFFAIIVLLQLGSNITAQNYGYYPESYPLQQQGGHQQNYYPDSYPIQHQGGYQQNYYPDSYQIQQQGGYQQNYYPDSYQIQQQGGYQQNYYPESYPIQQQGGFSHLGGPEPEFSSLGDFLKKLFFGLLHLIYPLLPQGLLNVFKMGYVGQ